MTLAQFIKKHGQTEASRLLGIPRMTLWRWMRGSPIAAIHRKWLESNGVTVPRARKKS